MKKLGIFLMVLCLFSFSNIEVKADEYDNLFNNTQNTTDNRQDTTNNTQDNYNPGYIQNENASSGGSSGCAAFSGLDSHIAKVSSTVVDLIQVAVPIVIIVFGMIDFLKGIMSQKDDEIKKAQGTFVKRLLAGALVFFIIFVVKFVVSIVAVDGGSDIISCIDWFISGP